MLFRSIVEANRPIRKTLRPCPEESVDWDTTENLYIEGDNLEVLKLLQESYLGKIKLIYIDPPYNTGHDFVYPDSFIMDNDEYNEGTGYFDENGDVNYSRENAATVCGLRSIRFQSIAMSIRHLTTDINLVRYQPKLYLQATLQDMKQLQQEGLSQPLDCHQKT